jgi:hypothetical protein
MDRFNKCFIRLIFFIIIYGNAFTDIDLKWKNMHIYVKIIHNLRSE